jgi:phosphatidylserine synthase
MDRFRVYANLSTLANGAVGAGAIAYILAGNKLWGMFLIVAGIGFDGMDGLFSRKSRRESGAFGRISDSAADAITFGLGPAALVAVHTDRTQLWSTWSSAALVVGGLVAALAIGRLVYFTLRGFHYPHFVGAPTPQTALAIVVAGLFFDTPAFAGTNPLILLALATFVAVLMVVPVPFPKIRRGNALRPAATGTAIALAVALVVLQFRPGSGSPLYWLALAAALVGAVGVGVYYVGGPLVAQRVTGTEH